MGNKSTLLAWLSINVFVGLNSLLDDFYLSHAQVDIIGR